MEYQTLISLDNEYFCRSLMHILLITKNRISDLHGYYFYELSDPSSSYVTPAVECLDWYQENKAGTIDNPYLNIGNISTDMWCPCYSDMRSLDQTFNTQPYFRYGLLCTAALIQRILPGTRVRLYTFFKCWNMALY